jgi:hypothetical protein
MMLVCIKVRHPPGGGGLRVRVRVLRCSGRVQQVINDVFLGVHVVPGGQDRMQQHVQRFCVFVSGLMLLACFDQPYYCCSVCCRCQQVCHPQVRRGGRWWGHH